MSDFPQRAVRHVQQSSGYQAFIAAPLPPQSETVYDGGLRTLLSQADRNSARLDALAALLSNPDLFVAMYVRYETVLSSHIEGTQKTLEDVLCARYACGAALRAQGCARGRQLCARHEQGPGAPVRIAQSTGPIGAALS